MPGRYRKVGEPRCHQAEVERAGRGELGCPVHHPGPSCEPSSLLGLRRAGRRWPRRGATPRDPRVSAGHAPRPGRWPGGTGTGWRSARCWWPPGPLPVRWRAEPARRSGWCRSDCRGPTARRPPARDRTARSDGRGPGSPLPGRRSVSAVASAPLRHPVRICQCPPWRSARSSRVMIGFPFSPPARWASAIIRLRRAYPSGSRASTTRWVPSGSGMPVRGWEAPVALTVSSAPKTVGRAKARAASAKRTTPYRPLWSVRASAARPSPDCLGGQFLGVAGTVEEGEVGVGVQFGVGHDSSGSSRVMRRWLRPTSGPVRPGAGGRPAAVTACRRALLRRDLDHHRSSDGQGPAQAVTADHGPCSTDRRAGTAVRRPRPDTDTGRPRGIGQLGGEGGGVHHGRGRWGDLPGPRGSGVACPRALPGVPRDEPGPLGRAAAPLQTGGHHAVRPDQVLHGGQGPGGPGIGVAHPAPELRRRPRRGRHGARSTAVGPTRRPAAGGRGSSSSPTPTTGYPVAERPRRLRTCRARGTRAARRTHPACGYPAGPAARSARAGRGSPPVGGPERPGSPPSGRPDHRGRRVRRRTARRPPRPRPW